MKIKVIGTQIYEDHEEKVEREFDDAIVDFREKISIKYKDGEIIFDKHSNIIELKNQNNIIIELNKEKILDYTTPYGIINLKTFGKDIFIEENPFKLTVRYTINLNETMEYENIVEIFEI